MSDGRYIMRNCVPDGDINFANISPGEIVQREWSFRVNTTPELQELVDRGELDPRNIMRGYDGRLFDGEGNFLAEVNTWNLSVNQTNSDYNPAGEKITWAVPQTHTVTLTFTETVIKDARILQEVVDSLRKDAPDAVLNFSGALKRAG